MTFPWIRSAAATATIALAATGCVPGADSADETQPAPTAATARRSTPAATPSTTVASPTSLEHLPARTIAQKTRAASLAATSLRMRGAVEEDGELMTLDIAMGAGGGEGTFTVAGASYVVRTIGRTVYLQMSESAIRAQAKADKSSAAETALVLKLLKNKWIKLSKVDKDTQDMVDLTTPGRFFRTVFAEDDTADVDGASKIAARTVDGVRCVGLTDGSATLWIDTTTGRLIRMTDGKNRFSFSAYGTTAAPKAPAKSQVLDGKAMGL